MKLYLWGRDTIHAPASTLAALVSAYTSGCDGVFLSVYESLDGELVVLHDERLENTTTFSGQVSETPFQGLRRLDIGVRFKDWRGTSVRYSAQPMSLKAMIQSLPRDLALVIELPVTSHVSDREILFARLIDTLKVHSRDATLLADSESDLRVIRSIDPGIQIATNSAVIADSIDLIALYSIDLIVAQEEDVFSDSGLTPLGTKLEKAHEVGGATAQVCIRPSVGVPTNKLLLLAGTHAFIDAVCTTSVLAVPGFCEGKRVIVAESFPGREVNTEMWALGYARVGDPCHVYQQDGIHIAIRPYITVPPAPTPTDLDRRVKLLEEEVALLRRRTATYHGGGVGFVHGVEGSFFAEVDVTSELAAQGTMFELAALNANPGRHQIPWNPDGTARTPQTDQDSHSFFDPHGAPPFVGSEHDEDDGFRVNSHFASEYSDNNYGSDVGDGRLLDITLRLERRGAYFAAYFKSISESDPRDWICSGVVRNDSLNPRIFLRFVGKRWRTTGFPVSPNHFTISRITVGIWSEQHAK